MGKKDNKIVRHNGGSQDESASAYQKYQKYKAKYMQLRSQARTQSRSQTGGADDETGQPVSAEQETGKVYVPIDAPVPAPEPAVEPAPFVPVADVDVPALEDRGVGADTNYDTLGQVDLSQWVNRENKTVTHKKMAADGSEYDKKVVITSPVNYYGEMVKRYGQPTYVVDQPNGVAKWIKGHTEKDISPHEYIMLKDEFVHHMKPAEHYDFMYSVIKVWVPPEKLIDVIKISGSISYDPLYKHLRARCASFAANWATFKTVFDLLEGKTSEYGENINTKEEKEEANRQITIDFVNKYGESGEFAEQIKAPHYPLEEVGSTGLLGLNTGIGL
jgi:hypothetical protein